LNQTFCLEVVDAPLMLNLLFPVFVANDIVIYQVFQDVVLSSVGVKRIIFFKIDRKLFFDLFN